MPPNVPSQTRQLTRAMAEVSKFGVEIADIKVDGGSLGFLLIHRLGGTPSDLGYIAHGLARAGHSVRCPLLYGHGGSPSLLGATTWSDWYGTVLRAHADLVRRCDMIVIGGLGVGALLALNLAADHGDTVHGLTLFAPTFWPNGWAMPWYGKVLRHIGSKRLANLFRLDERPPFGLKDEDLRQQVLERRLAEGRSLDDVNGRFGGTLLEVKWLADQVTPRLGEVAQPCLVFHPRFDDRSQLGASELLQLRLGGIVDLVVLEDSYHLVTLDRQRDLVLQRVVAFGGALPHIIRQSRSPTSLRDAQLDLPE